MPAATAGPAEAGWLTGALRRAGVLPRGEVEDVAARPNPAFNSHVLHLRLRYSTDAPAAAPRRLLLKRSLDAAWARAAGEREVAFYRAVAARPDRPPVTVPCYAAGHDPAGDTWYVLLRDLSATHRPALTRDQQLTPGANVPSEVDLGRVVDALARQHAGWWEHPRLRPGADAVATPWSPFEDGAAYERFAARAASTWPDLVRDHLDRIPPAVRAAVDGAVEGLPRLWARRLAGCVPPRRGVTLAHGDAYFANFLCPRPGGAGGAGATDGEESWSGRGGTYLIDWQSPGVHLGTEDVAALCATFWTPAQRAAGGRGRRVLRRYLEGLAAGGVRDYSWDDLLDDYRCSVSLWLTVPLQDAADGASADYWAPKLACLAAAYTDLDCAALVRR
jgi:hypothetical protein